MSPTLPTELLAHIVALAVPPPGQFTLRHRYAVLRSVALANSTLRAIAQEHLFTHVRLKDRRAVTAFRYAITGDLTRLGDKVVAVCVGDAESGKVGGDRDDLAELTALAEAIAACPNVREVTLCDLELEADDLYLFPAVRRLHLRNCYISTGLTTPGQLSIPSHVLYDLTHLQITSPFPASVWGLLLHPHLLPSLVSLSVKSPAALDDQPLGSPDTFEFALSAVAPQLIEFATLGHSHLAKLLTKSLLWQHFSALRHLTLASARPHQALLQLPTRIASLRVDFQPRSPDGFTVEMSQIGIQIFNEEVEGVRELEEICFPGWESLTVNGTISRRVHVEAWVKFEQEGVRVVHLPNNAPFVSRI